MGWRRLTGPASHAAPRSTGNLEVAVTGIRNKHGQKRIHPRSGPSVTEGDSALPQGAGKRSDEGAGGGLVSTLIGLTLVAGSALGQHLRPRTVRPSPTNSRMVRIARERYEAAAERGEATLQNWIRVGQAAETKNREIATRFIERSLDDVVDFVSVRPEVGHLVDAQVTNVIESLRENPERLDALVQVIADRYMDFLAVHPEQIHALLGQQSVSLAGEMRETMQEMTVAGDDALERAVRSWLRKLPRGALPGPPPEVRTRLRRGR